MKTIKNILSPFVLSVVLSIMLHIILIAWFSGIGGFDFIDSFADKEFIADIVSEKIQKSGLTKALKNSIPDNAEVDSSVKTDAETTDAKTGENTPDRSNNSENLHEESKSATPDEPITADDDKAENGRDLKAEGANAGKEPESNMKPKDSSAELLKSARERLYFDIYWIGIYVGRAILEAVNSGGDLKITSEVHSSPFISAFYKVEDHAESQITNGIPSFFKIKQREGKRTSDKETFFDINSRKVTHVNHIKGTRDEYTFNTETLWDLMSGFYYLRTQRLNVGETVYINIFDSNKFYQAEVHVLRKDRIKLPDGNELSAIVVKPALKSEGLFQNKGDISIWLTDDEVKIPLRVETEVPIGKVVAVLKAVETESRK